MEEGGAEELPAALPEVLLFAQGKAQWPGGVGSKLSEPPPPLLPSSLTLGGDFREGSWRARCWCGAGEWRPARMDVERSQGSEERYRAFSFSKRSASLPAYLSQQEASGARNRAERSDLAGGSQGQVQVAWLPPFKRPTSPAARPPKAWLQICRLNGLPHTHRSRSPSTRLS